jgi:hypothetical protein
LPIGRRTLRNFRYCQTTARENETLATIRGQLEKAAFAEAWEQGRR